MPKTSVKVAVSLPRDLYRQVEAIRKKQRNSRSAVVARALASWIDSARTEEEVRRYIQGYREIPEDPAEVEAFRAIAAHALAGEAWE